MQKKNNKMTIYKRILGVSLAGIMLTVGFLADVDNKNVQTAYAVTTSEEKEYSVGNSIFKYKELEDGTIEISDYEGEDTKVIIPDKINGKNVTSIGAYAFAYCNKLISVEIPSTVKNLGKGVFERNKNLISVEIPEGVNSIGDYMFFYCSSLASVKIPNSVTTIGACAFYNCNSLEEIELPDNLVTIPRSIFSDCEKLKKVNIPDSVTTIEGGAFYDCSSLSDIEIPDSVTTIGGGAFYDCSSLSDIEIPENVLNIEGNVFWGCKNLRNIEVSPDNIKYKSVDGILFNYDMSEIISYPAQKESKTYCIPDSVITIDNNAFDECSSLTSIKIPKYANFRYTGGIFIFTGCSNLENIEVEDGNESYKSQDGILFDFDMTTLIKYPAKKKNTSYSIPDSVIRIEAGAFENCSNLKNIIIPNGVTYIGVNAFYDCSALEKIEVNTENKDYKSQDGILYSFDMTTLIKYPEGKIEKTYTIPEGVEDLEAYAIMGCNNLVTITIPGSVKYIGHFDGCRNLEAFMVASDNSRYASQDGILYSKSMDIIWKYPSAKKGYYVMPDSVTYIDDGIWKEGYGEGAFYACNGLTGIEISKGVTEIEKFEVVDCNNLSIVKIPDSVEYIYPDVFANCSKLTIWGSKNSYAERYAGMNNIKFSSGEGDANGDGQINTQDAVLIKKYLAEYDNVDINLEASDVNGDGEVTSADAVLLLKYLAEYDVTLGR